MRSSVRCDAQERELAASPVVINQERESRTTPPGCCNGPASVLRRRSTVRAASSSLRVARAALVSWDPRTNASAASRSWPVTCRFAAASPTDGSFGTDRFIDAEFARRACHDQQEGLVSESALGSLLPPARRSAMPADPDCRFLFVGGVVVRAAVWAAGSRWRAGCSFLFGRSGHRRVFVAAVSASRFDAGPSGGQKAAGACRDGGGVGAARTGRLEGLLAREGTCQAAIRTLRATAELGRVPARALGDVGVEPVPGVRRPPGLMGGLGGPSAACVSRPRTARRSASGRRTG